MGDHKKGGQRGAGGGFGGSGYRGAHSGRGGNHGGKKEGCAVTAIALVGGLVTALGALGYGAVELASRALS